MIKIMRLLPFMQVQEKISFFFWLREGAGLVFFTGLLLYVASFFVGNRKAVR